MKGKNSKIDLPVLLFVQLVISWRLARFQSDLIGIYLLNEYREAKTHSSRSETSPDTIKTQVVQTTGQVSRFYFFSP